MISAKKDGLLCFQVDYRRLNAVTFRDLYPIPLMDKSIDFLKNSTVLSTLNANYAY